MELDNFIVYENDSIREAMAKINKNGQGIVVVVDNNSRVKGTLTDGDIRRALLRGYILNSPVKDIYNRDFIYVTEPVSYIKLQNVVSSEKFKKRFRVVDFVRIVVIDAQQRFRDLILVNIRTLSYRSVISGKKRGRYPIRRILVTGGAGYIGSVLVRKLLEAGYKVIVLDNLLYGDIGIRDLYSNPDFKLVKGDITDIKDILTLVGQIDAIVHLAAIVGDPASRIIPKETIEINYFATVLLSEVARYFNIRRFIFASTCSVYGISDPDRILDETSPPNPISLYAETKLRSEEYLRRQAGDDFCPVILRFGTAYGYSPRMRFDLVINLLTAMAYFERTIKIFGGEQWRPFTHVSDISYAVIRAIEKEPRKVSGEVFNIVGENLQIGSLADIIKDFIPDIEVEIIKEKKDLRSYRVSGEKAKKILGFVPLKTVRDGVREIIYTLETNRISDYRADIYSNYKKLRHIMESENL